MSSIVSQLLERPVSDAAGGVLETAAGLGYRLWAGIGIFFGLGESWAHDRDLVACGDAAEVAYSSRLP